MQLFQYQWEHKDIPNLDILSEQEQARAGNMQNKDSYYQFIWSRYYLRTLLGKECNQAADSINIILSENGKPYIKDTPLHFSMAHKNKDIVISLHDSPCGVDIESLEQNINTERLSKRLLDDNEMALYKKSDNKKKVFLTLWSIKEAITKCEGETVLSFSKRLQLIDLSESTFRYSLNDNKEYTGSITRNETTVISCATITNKSSPL